MKKRKILTICYLLITGSILPIDLSKEIVNYMKNHYLVSKMADSLYLVESNKIILGASDNFKNDFLERNIAFGYILRISPDAQPDFFQGHLALSPNSVDDKKWMSEKLHFFGTYDSKTNKILKFSVDLFDLVERKKYEKDHQPKKEVKLPAGPVYYVNIISVGIQSDMQWGGGSLTRVSEGGTLILLEDTKKEGRGVKEVDKKLKYFKGTWWKVCTNTGIIGYVLYDPVAKNLMPSSTSADGKK